MEMNKQQATFLQTALEQWEKDQLLAPETAHNLRQSIVVRPFDWRRLARYSFWASLACVLIALGALLFDDWLLKMAARLFEASSFFLCLFFGILSGLCYTWAFYRRKSHPQNTYSNEALVLLGSIGTATALGFGGHALGSVEQHLGALTLLATLIYGTLGIFFRSGTMWFMALLALGVWFGVKTTDWAGTNGYFMGANIPLRFVFLGALLIVFAFIATKYRKLVVLTDATYVGGMIYFFGALWLLSIFGNYSSIELWHGVRQYNFLPWAIVMAITSMCSIYWGLKTEDTVARGFGITFLLLNLYTRFFEYFWDNTHKALFFGILGISFWALGSYAERLWKLAFLKTDNRNIPSN